MDRSRRGLLAGAAAALGFGSGCLSDSPSPGAEALSLSLGDAGRTEAGSLRIRITVANTAAVPAAGTCYVHAVEPGETHTEARYFELEADETVSEQVAFPDVSADGFWESEGYVDATVD